MLVSIAETSTLDNHGVVQQRTAIWLLDRLHPVEQLGKLAVVPTHYLRIHIPLLLYRFPRCGAIVIFGHARGVLVVRQGMPGALHFGDEVERESRG